MSKVRWYRFGNVKPPGNTRLCVYREGKAKEGEQYADLYMPYSYDVENQLFWSGPRVMGPPHVDDLWCEFEEVYHLIKPTGVESAEMVYRTLNERRATENDLFLKRVSLDQVKKGHLYHIHIKPADLINDHPWYDPIYLGRADFDGHEVKTKDCCFAVRCGALNPWDGRLSTHKVEYLYEVAPL